jgi:truncated hemoglobin YjbI
MTRSDFPITPPPTLFEAVGGRSAVERAHKIFYDRVYAHPWLKLFFDGIDQKHIEDQQTDFMIANMGGPKSYCGKFPIPAHRHMNITAELFDLRHEMLKESLVEANIPIKAAEEWLIMDRAFRRRLVKESLDDCEKRFFTDEIIDIPKPELKTNVIWSLLKLSSNDT